ncbi:SDR family oxidoreductase [Mechercharimyces sp. CAU 1602]|uniref:SDR family NAD(P)-dependent oxidoreductase n=1 Tax=Mechercharimyces sp. CAU 1602 TaxID=2973933 RepID=UPI002163950F|nr:SDR family oxidoreductase [Mechercharimyces sp. CAU 1602]MCS1352537.1 SDR family oxidoreductase [Mechercharimyces sp. CAU 1602]
MKSNKTALITGASSGIGYELARIHAAHGGDLVIVARREDKLKALKKDLEKQYGVNVLLIKKDLTLPNAPTEIYEEVKQAGVEVNYLINNAGFGGHGKFHERSWEEDLSMINLNVVALTALTRLFLPDFVKRNEGKILNISSTASLMAGPMQAIYFASKAFVTSFSNAIAEELNDTKITVTALLPGATESEFENTAGLNNTALFKKPISASIVAKDGYEGMIEGKLNVISGLNLLQRIQIATMPFFPKRFQLRAVRRIQEK